MTRRPESLAAPPDAPPDADVGVAICVATLAIQTAATRMCFSMARDLMVTIPLLIARRNGLPAAPGRAADGGPLFSLGRLGLPINTAVVVYGALMMVNIAWPRASVYDPAGGHWYLRWFSVVFVAGTLAAGSLARLRQRSEAAAATAPRPRAAADLARAAE